MKKEFIRNNNAKTFRKEFYKFCKENKNDKIAKEDEAKRLWEEHKPIKVKAYNVYHEEFADIKIDQTNNRSNEGVRNAKPNFSLKDFNLNLFNDLSLIVMICSIVTMSIFMIIDITLISTLDISMWLFATILLAPLSIVLSVIIWDMTKFRHFEKYDETVVKLQKKLSKTKKMFKATFERCRFKNGNIKWTLFEKEINDWYKERIIHKMENPYEVDKKKTVVSSDNFITSGGVYAWWYRGEVVYIGKANNFKRRMKEHTLGLKDPVNHNEHKYNVGIQAWELDIQILAITNSEDEQSVLESYYFDKYNNGQLLNSTGTLSWKKIMMKEQYRQAWDKIKAKVNY